MFKLFALLNLKGIFHAAMVIIKLPDDTKSYRNACNFISI